MAITKKMIGSSDISSQGRLRHRAINPALALFRVRGRCCLRGRPSVTKQIISYLNLPAQRWLSPLQLSTKFNSWRFGPEKKKETLLNSQGTNHNLSMRHWCLQSQTYVISRLNEKRYWQKEHIRKMVIWQLKMQRTPGILPFEKQLFTTGCSAR